MNEWVLVAWETGPGEIDWDFGVAVLTLSGEWRLRFGDIDYFPYLGYTPKWWRPIENLPR